MSDPRRRSPLHHRSEIAAEGAARMVEELHLVKLVLRGDPTALVDPVRNALGCDLPTEACTAWQGDGFALLWMGPDEWWVIGEWAGEEGPAAIGRLDRALTGIHHQLVDVTDSYTAIALSGPRAGDMLMKLTTLDLHPRSFAEGRVAGSMFGHTQATLWRLSDDHHGNPRFRVLVRWSTSDYLWCLLADAGCEHGLPTQEPLSGEIWRLER